MFHIVDDQPNICSVIEATLNEFGYKSLTFTCPLEYLDYVHSPQFTKPLAVITDINMPRMNGYSLIHEVSEIISDLRFIVISGEPHIQSPHQSRACFFLYKPFRFEKLMETIEKVLVCENLSPSCQHGCESSGNREMFGIHDWRCPQECSIHREKCGR